MDAVIVFPSGIIGPHDFRPSLLGELVLACSHGRLRAYVQGGYNFVDVRDVAHGLMAAAEKACPGDGYILSGHEVAVPDLLQTIDVASGNSTRRLCLPFGLTRALSFLLPAYYWMTRGRPLFTTYSLDVVSSNCSMSHERAARQLGFSPRPFLETIEDTVRWFSQQGKLGGP